MNIRRENWKGRYWTVARDDKGRILSRTKYTKGLGDAKAQFKETRTFDADVKRTKLKRVYEIESSPKKANVSKGANYTITIEFDNGIKRSARSMKFYDRKEIPRRREEALENLHYRVAEAFGESYDKDIGADIISEYKGEYTIRESIVRYANA